MELLVREKHKENDRSVDIEVTRFALADGVKKNGPRRFYFSVRLEPKKNGQENEGEGWRTLNAIMKSIWNSLDIRGWFHFGSSTSSCQFVFLFSIGIVFLLSSFPAMRKFTLGEPLNKKFIGRPISRAIAWPSLCTAKR